MQRKLTALIIIASSNIMNLMQLEKPLIYLTEVSYLLVWGPVCKIAMLSFSDYLRSTNPKQIPFM